MTNLPRRFCPECEDPLEGQVAIHALTGEHWECHEARTEAGNELKEPIFDSAWKPMPDKLEGVKAIGWLTPNGTFYGCVYGVHVALGEALADYFYPRTEEDKSNLVHGGGRRLEEENWVHIGPGGAYCSKKPTQSQLDVLWDWFTTLPKDCEAYRTLNWLFHPTDE